MKEYVFNTFLFAILVTVAAFGVAAFTLLVMPNERKNLS